jgi:hypothetical protein
VTIHEIIAWLGQIRHVARFHCSPIAVAALDEAIVLLREKP